MVNDLENYLERSELPLQIYSIFIIYYIKNAYTADSIISKLNEIRCGARYPSAITQHYRKYLGKLKEDLRAKLIYYSSCSFTNSME